MKTISTQRKAAATLILACILSMTVDAEAQKTSDYAGDWTLASTSLTVTVDSWGAHCGPRPKSYSTKSSQPIKIMAKGKHLVFSLGAVRTNRCFHTNPRLRVVDQSAQVGRWSVTCRTAPNDPKAERGEYTLKANGTNRLDYAAESKYDWSLEGDRCLVYTQERRVYVRTPGSDIPPSTPNASTAAGKPTGNRCDPNVPLQSLFLTPQNTKIGPGEFVCLKAMAVNTDNCRSQIKAKWSAFQNGQKVNGLLADNGCFFAGETAAESEGTYSVLASSQGLQAGADVTVAFPDIDVLLSAQLKPLDSIAQNPLHNDATSDSNNQQAIAPTYPQDSISPLQTPNMATELPVKTIVAIAIIVLLLLSLIIIVYILALKEKHRSSKPPAKGRPKQPLKRPKEPLVVETTKEETDPEETLAPAPVTVCPKCSKEYPGGATFCSADGSKLTEKSRLKTEGSPVSGESAERRGMICPNCHRGYNADARFCPHDAEQLIPYDLWRRSQI